MEDDLKPIVYVILLVIFLIARIIRGAKKFQKGQAEKKAEIPPVFAEAGETPPLAPVEKKRLPKKTGTEIRQKVYTPPKPKKTTRASELLMPGSIEAIELEKPIDRHEKEEGVSAIAEKMKFVIPAEEEEQPAFEFNPREAFMFKTLLDRKFDV
ncbi:MAG TPA: hypothetical protein VNJ07_08700 [Chitinophagales bacterium]|nr:hypothetical protein [Chitinophagales bacterium]